MSAGAIAAGAALLWLVSQRRGSAPAPTPVPSGNTQPVQPGTAPNQGDTLSKTLLTSGVSLATTVTGIIAKGIGGGTGAATTTSAALTTSLMTGYTAGAGGVVVAAIILVAIIATQVAMGISANITNKHYWQEKYLLEDTTPFVFAEKLFNQLTAKLQKWVMPDGKELPAGWSTANARLTIDLSPAQLRTLALAVLYIATWPRQAMNDALVKYYAFMGWTPQMMANTPVMQTVAAGNAYPGKNFFEDTAQRTMGALGFNNPVNGVAYVLKGIRSMVSQQVWDAMTAPFSAQDMQAAAVTVFGADLSRIEASLKFLGTTKAMFLASVEGYGSHSGGWGAFVETLGRIFGWAVEMGPPGQSGPAGVTYWVTNVPTPYPLTTWWLIDPVTGSRFAPLETHSDNVLRVSVKGAPIMPWQANGPLAGFAGLGQRRVRVGRFAAGECVAPDGSLVGCGDPAVVAAVQARQQQTAAAKAFIRANNSTTTSKLVQGGGGGGLLVAAAGLGLAVLLLGRKG